jgi:hypothetical protein
MNKNQSQVRSSVKITLVAVLIVVLATFILSACSMISNIKSTNNSNTTSTIPSSGLSSVQAKTIATDYYKEETNTRGRVDDDKTELDTYTTHESTGDADITYSSQVYKFYFTDGSTIYVGKTSGDIYYASITSK